MKNTHSTAASALAEGAVLFGRTPAGERLVALLGQGSPGQRKLADFVMRHPIRVAALSIEDLAAVTGVSAPTISRFARELGFRGFAEFRNAAAEAMQVLLDPVTKLRRQLDGAPMPAGGGMIEAAKSLLERIDAARLSQQATRLATDIKRARTVHVMGFGLSSHIAALLVLGLQPFCPNVAGVVEFGGTEVAAGRLMAIGPEDMLMAISFPRYASDVVHLTRYARDRGARVVAITDSAASPLAPLASELFLAPADHPTLSSSMIGALAVVETIVTTVMLSDPANAEKAALLGDAIGGYLHAV